MCQKDPEKATEQSSTREGSNRCNETELNYLLPDNLTLWAHLRQSLESIIPELGYSKADLRHRLKLAVTWSSSNDVGNNVESFGSHLLQSLKSIAVKQDYSKALDENVDVFEGDFQTWVQQRYMRRILYRENKHFVLDTVALQKMCLQFRLKRISQHAFRIITSAPQDIESICKTLDRELQDYTAALQDMSYMHKFGLKSNAKDPFILTTEKTSHQALLKDVWTKKPWILNEQDSKVNCGHSKATDEDPKAPNATSQATGTNGGSQTITNVSQLFRELPDFPSGVPPPHDRKKQFKISRNASRRFRKETFGKYLTIVGLAVVGNMFLIGPMILMVLKPGLVTSLATTSVCVTVFAAVAPSFLHTLGEVMSATAAYAAVLVVFVGTSGGGTSV